MANSISIGRPIFLNENNENEKNKIQSISLPMAAEFIPNKYAKLFEYVKQLQVLTKENRELIRQVNQQLKKLKEPKNSDNSNLFNTNSNNINANVPYYTILPLLNNVINENNAILQRKEKKWSRLEPSIRFL